MPDALRGLDVREAEVRLGEQGSLRRVLGLRSVPDHTTLHRFLTRLEPGPIEAALGEAAAGQEKPAAAGVGRAWPWMRPG